MALINCPECSKEISSKVKACPHCGFPMDENIEETQKVEISSVKLTIDNNKKKKITLLVIAILIIVSIFTIAYQHNKKLEIEEYNANIMILKEDMISSGVLAEEMLDLTSRVWSDAIYENYDIETHYWTARSIYDFYDFDTALKNLFEDSTVKKNIESIKNSKSNIADKMKKLNNPPKSYDMTYETLLELYSAYQGITDLAINPEGSLSDFNRNSDDKINEFIRLYEKIETICPET